MNNSIKLAGWLSAATLMLLVAGCGPASVPDGFVDPDKDLVSINGGVSVGSDAHVGDLESVNGSIRVGDNSQVGQVSNVNGSTSLNPGARAEGIQSVNGSITADAVTVDGDVRSVNGGIRLEDDTSVGGDVRSVNGTMRLTQTTVTGSVITYNGDIVLYEGTRVKGDIRVDDSWDFDLGDVKINVSRPTIVVHAGAVVEGKLDFKREVELWVHESVEIGEVSGAEISHFSGDNPPRT